MGQVGVEALSQQAAFPWETQLKSAGSNPARRYITTQPTPTLTLTLSVPQAL